MRERSGHKLQLDYECIIEFAEWAWDNLLFSEINGHYEVSLEKVAGRSPGNCCPWCDREEMTRISFVIGNSLSRPIYPKISINPLDPTQI